MEIREADIAAMGRAELEQVIDRAVRPDVPLRVLFAALDRYTELLRPALDDEPAPRPQPEQPPATTATTPTAATAPMPPTLTDPGHPSGATPAPGTPEAQGPPGVP